MDSITVCGMTQIRQKDRVNKEMSMIIKPKIDNSQSNCLSFPYPSSCPLSDSFQL